MVSDDFTTKFCLEKTAPFFSMLTDVMSRIIICILGQALNLSKNFLVLKKVSSEESLAQQTLLVGLVKYITSYSFFSALIPSKRRQKFFPVVKRFLSFQLSFLHCQ